MSILIWHTLPLKEGGGPSAYLKHYKDYLREEHIEEVVFLGDVLGGVEICPSSSRSSPSIVPAIILKVARKIQNVFVSLVRGNRPSLSGLKTALRNNEISYKGLPDSLYVYSVIQFHSTWELYKARSFLDGYKGKVLLMSHSPKPWHLEFIEDQAGLTVDEVGPRLVRRIKKIDEYAFRHADALVFPCKEALEPYKKYWELFSDFVSKKPLIFVPTAMQVRNDDTDSSISHMRRNDNHLNSEITGFFAGRHVAVKGYDLLCRIGPEALKRWPELRIICAGSLSETYRCSAIGWTELGWRNDVPELMKNADFYFLPNRDTYFDLALLEAMGNALPVVLSNTGGNKYFHRFRLPGLVYFEPESQESLLEAIGKMLAFSTEQRRSFGQQNRDVINKHFTFSSFHKAYLKQINLLLQ